MKNLFQKARGAAAAAVSSRWFIPAQTAVSALAVCLGLNVAGSAILLAFMFFLLIFSDDTLAAICPALLTVMTLTSFYDNYYALVKYAWVIVPLGAAFVVHLAAYRGRIIKGRFALPYAAVSAALIIGGIGTIPVDEYFSELALYYVLGLGAGMLLLYLLVSERMSRERDYDTVERLAALMYGMAVVAALIILRFYVVKWQYLEGNFHTPFIKYRNFCTTVMLFGLPSAGMLIRRSRWHFAGMFFIYASMLIAGSRSGLLFGSLEFAMSLVYIYISDKPRRAVYRRIATVCALPVAALSVYLVYVFFMSDGGRFGTYIIKPYEARTSFYPQGVKDFLEKPLLGWGLGNMKNYGIWYGVPGSIVFYHNSTLQTLASLGIVGGAAFLWQFVVRLRTLRDAKGTPGFMIFIPYVGVLLMSQTNPGLYCPLPTALLLMLMFAALEAGKAAASAKNTKSTAEKSAN